MAAISIRNLVKRYGNFTVIPDLNLEIADQSSSSLSGRQAAASRHCCGSSPGLEPITSGELYIGDKRVNGIPAAQRDIAMVFQDYALYPHMRVYDNMAFALELRGMSKAGNRRAGAGRRRPCCTSMPISIASPRNYPAASASGSPWAGPSCATRKVFLFDEPLSNLDAKLRAQVRAEIKSLSQQLRTTMVFVTHDQIEAMTMADRIVVLQSGVVQQYDTPEVVYEQPANQFVAGFIGSPTMNFLPVEMRDDAARFSQTDAARAARRRGLQPGEDAAGKGVLGVRPEHFEVVPDAASGIPVQIKLVEPLGSDTLIHFDVAGAAAIARVDPVAEAEARRAAVSAAEGRQDTSVRHRDRPGIAMSSRGLPEEQIRGPRGRRPGRARTVICLGLSALDQIWRVPRVFLGRGPEDQGLEYDTPAAEWPQPRLSPSPGSAVSPRSGAAAATMRPGTRCARRFRGRGRRQSIPAVRDGKSSVSGILVDSAGERQIVNFRGQFPEAADWLPLGRNRWRIVGARRSALARGREGAVVKRAREAFRQSSMQMSLMRPYSKRCCR